MAITKEMLDELLKDYRGPEDLTGEEGLLKQLTKALVERAMGAELTEHLGYEKHEAGEKPSDNRRNGTSPQTDRRASPPAGPTRWWNLWKRGAIGSWSRCIRSCSLTRSW